MTLDEKDRIILINFRLEQAEQTIEEAELLITNKKLRGAVNRIYYSIFYSLSALALKHQVKLSKHSKLLGWFNKTFIKEKTIDVKYGKILRQAFESRTESDYRIFTEFTREELSSMLADAKDFIDKMKEMLK